jgi:hypothetical protein
MIVIYIFAAIGVWACSASFFLWLRDRTGNSGRYKHWTEE